MFPLFQNPDGANAQARAVLAYLSAHDGLEGTYDVMRREYRARPEVARWHNCREQGYVVSMRSIHGGRQINIAWYEHRNTDSICALVWEQVTISGNPPSIETMNPKRDSKWDTDHSEPYGRAMEMALWIYGRLVAFWEETKEEETLGDYMRARRAAARAEGGAA